MSEKLRSTFGRVTDAVREFTVAQRTLALLAAAILVVAVVALVSFLSRPTLTPLYSGLSGADASAIVDQLESEGVAYELADGGATILVPEDQVYDQRLTAAAAGLPSKSSGGYTLLDEMGVTSSEFQQDVTYKRAIEGELAATIGELAGVQTASVQLAIPEKTVFADEERTPTASVFVATEPGETLSNDQVEAIVHLTSASVDGMAPTDVAVIDAAGNVLSEVGVGTGAADTQASEYEQQVTAQVQKMLDNVVGAGNATVAVKADVSTTTSERLVEEFTLPEGEPALNESTATEDYTGAGGVGAGVLGPDNIAVPNGTGGDSTYTTEENTRNNAVNKTTETVTTPPGDVVRQTVSVALDARAAGALDQGALTDLVSAAAGIDAARGDLVQVEVLPFNTSAADSAAAALAAADAAAAAAAQRQTIRNAVLVGAAVLALILILVARSRRRRREQRETLDLGELGLLAATEPLPDPDEDEPTTIEAPPAPVAINPPMPRHNDLDQRRAEIDALAATDPQKTVDYLRIMLESDKAGATR